MGGAISVFCLRRCGPEAAVSQGARQLCVSAVYPSVILGRQSWREFRQEGQAVWESQPEPNSLFGNYAYAHSCIART